MGVDLLTIISLGLAVLILVALNSIRTILVLIRNELEYLNDTVDNDEEVV